MKTVYSEKTWLCKKADIYRTAVVEQEDPSNAILESSVIIAPKYGFLARLGFVDPSIQTIMMSQEELQDAGLSDVQDRLKLTLQTSETIFKHLSKNCLECVRQDNCADRSRLAGLAHDLRSEAFNP